MANRLVSFLQDCPIRVQLWDDFIVHAGGDVPEFVIRIQSRAALHNLVFVPDFHFLEQYAQGAIIIDGELTNLMCEVRRAWSQATPRFLSWLKLLRSSHARGNTQHRRSNVAHHYDLGNDFYRLWLDEQLLYTCAYFPSVECSLEEAQVAKMDHVCRKLRLQPGEAVIEAGSGWGALALHMARHYGVSVRSYNVSKEQIRYARERAEREGLADRVEFVEDDWANIDGPCDAFVSVGMLEHVGPENFSRLGTVIAKCLGTTGRGLLHTIGFNHASKLNPWIERRIFPGAQPPTLKQMMDIFEPFHMSVLDVENIRLHYAETCRHWLQRFEQSLDVLRHSFDDVFIRTWRMYLAASAASFETGELQLYQVVFAPRPNNEVPMTRAHLYP